MKLNNIEVNGSCHELGLFQMNSDEAVVTDPCYEFGTKCQVQVANVLQGTWKGFVFRKTDELAVQWRSTRLIELYKSLEESIPLDKQWNSTQPLPRKTTFEEMSREAIKETEDNDCKYVSVLISHHGSIDPFTSLDNEWELIKTSIGVDSGQMSIAPISSWATEKVSLNYEGLSTPNNEYPDMPHRGNDGPYWDVAQITSSSKHHAGIFDNRAVVSSTGYGDGSYNGFTLTHNGKVVGIAVVFIPDW